MNFPEEEEIRRASEELKEAVMVACSDLELALKVMTVVMVSAGASPYARFQVSFVCPDEEAVNQTEICLGVIAAKTSMMGNKPKFKIWTTRDTSLRVNPIVNFDVHRDWSS